MTAGQYKPIPVSGFSEPISLVEAKRHLKVDFTDDDLLIQAMITVAREYCESYTNRALIPKTVTHILGCFPSPKQGNTLATIELFQTPVTSITTLSYYDSDNEVQNYTANDYIFTNVTQPAQIMRTVNNTWADTAPRFDAVTIVYTAGYSTAGDVPQAIKQAMLLIIGDLYERRENFVKKLPTAAEWLLNPYRIIAI